MILLAGHPAAAALCALLWAVLACLLPLLGPARRHQAIWVLILGGVPVLGWLTYLCGPVLGVLVLALGLSLLVWPPLRRGRGQGMH
ncbi:MAG: DUF2484 family protein [Paracoccus sp. (in: a-proteobacteria)]|uniref:DUF2484 family protein n=1 Tax=Paracoccus sp. TaxID=267 RepID=UPI0039E65AF8